MPSSSSLELSKRKRESDLCNRTEAPRLPLLKPSKNVFPNVRHRTRRGSTRNDIMCAFGSWLWALDFWDFFYRKLIQSPECHCSAWANLEDTDTTVELSEIDLFIFGPAKLWHTKYPGSMIYRRAICSGYWGFSNQNAVNVPVRLCGSNCSVNFALVLCLAKCWFTSYFCLM